MNKRILLTITFLILAIILLSYLNAVDREERQISQENAVIWLKYADESRAVSFADIKNLEQYTFDAVLRSSAGGEKKNSYKGVMLKDLLEAQGIRFSGISQVVTRAADGYTVVLGSQEVLEEDNVYIVYEMNGKSLKTKQDGGSGPYQLIIRKDAFGQRWNKFLMELDIR